MKRKANGGYQSDLRQGHRKYVRAKRYQTQRVAYLPKLPYAARVQRSPNERKVSDLAVTTYQVNQGGTFTLLHAPVPGTDYTQRIGRRTVPKSVYIRGHVVLEQAFNLAAATTTFAGQARMILFIDYQPNAATPAVLDLLVSATPESQLQLNNRDRFKILKDKLFEFDPIIVVGAGTEVEFNRTAYPLKCYKKLNMETIFNAGTAGTIADITSGALYLFWIGSWAAGASSDGVAVVSTRVRFLDA